MPPSKPKELFRSPISWVSPKAQPLSSLMESNHFSRHQLIPRNSKRESNSCLFWVCSTSTAAFISLEATVTISQLSPWWLQLLAVGIVSIKDMLPRSNPMPRSLKGFSGSAAMLIPSISTIALFWYFASTDNHTWVFLAFCMLSSSSYWSDLAIRFL